MLNKVGLDRTDTVTVRGHEVSPRDVVAACLPDPATLGDRMRGRTCAGTWVTGTGKDGSPREVYLYHLADNEETMARDGSQAVVWQTAINPVIALELLGERNVDRHRRAGSRGLPGRAVPRPAHRPRLPLGHGGAHSLELAERCQSPGEQRRRPMRRRPAGFVDPAGLAAQPVAPAEQLVGDLGVAARVADHDDLAVVHLLAVDQPSVLGGAGAAPAAGLDLELLALVGQLEEAGRALEELAAEVGEEAEGVDVGVELVDHAGELLDLGRCVELRLVAHEVLEAAVGRRVLRRQLEEVELRARRRRPPPTRRGGTTRRRRRGRAGCRAARGGHGSRGCGGSGGRAVLLPEPIVP